MEPAYIKADAFERDPSAARQASNDGPVFITQDGQPTHVLVTAAEFERLAGMVRRTLWDAFSGRPAPGEDGGEFEIPKANIRTRPASFDD
ncbi:type II toxin-antitoxin system prevent-host-death family antitoxin [Sphingobium yanoikuyae]|uniref:type II toxin-antitoxin system prevent-host-death family antitoxin n=1 Tax=Sphingobium yanoikuyae TaxID=13690 RepID=UPI002FDD72BF